MDSRFGVPAGRVAGALLRAWWVIVIGAVLGAGVAYLVSASRTPVFQSTATLYFSLRTASSGSDINQGQTYTQNQMLSFAQLATSALVLEPVRDELDLDLTVSQLRNLTVVSIPQNTVILDVTSTATDRDSAAGRANAIAESLVSAVEDVAPKDEAGAATVSARIIEPAVPPLFQSAPNKQRDALLGGLAGAVLAALLVAIWALLDTRIRTETALRRATSLPVLGRIPRSKRKDRRPVVDVEPNGRGAEAYRGLRSNLRFTAVEKGIATILVTSSVPGEGKTTTAVNLALTYAEAGLRTLLLDSDLRRPMVAEVLGLENSVGLTTVLVGSLDAEEAMLTWGRSLLRVLPAGEVPPNPAELLASARMIEVLRELADQFDVVVVDAAPLLSVADATIIAQHVDATIVVADVTKAHLGQLTRSLAALEGVQVPVGGVVLNRVPPTRRDSYNYYALTEEETNRRRLGGRSAAKKADEVAGEPPEESDDYLGGPRRTKD